MGRLGHKRCGQQRVANHVHVFGGGGFKGLVVHIAPAAIGVGQTCAHGNGARAHIGQHVQHIGFNVVFSFKPNRIGFGIHANGFVVAAVLQHAAEVFGPELFKQGAFRRDVGVGVQNQHLGLGLGLLKVVRHLAGTLVGARGAAVGGKGNRNSVHAAVAHGFQLSAQGHGFGAGFPSLQNLAGGLSRSQAFYAVPHHVHAGGHNEFVIANGIATRQQHGFFGRINVRDAVFDMGNTVLAAQRVVRRGDIRHGFAAAQHEVGHWARHKRFIGLHQHHVDLVLRKHAHVFGSSRPAIAATNDHHLGMLGHAGGAGAQPQTGERGQPTPSGGLLQKTPSAKFAGGGAKF